MSSFLKHRLDLRIHANAFYRCSCRPCLGSIQAFVGEERVFGAVGASVRLQAAGTAGLMAAVYL